MHLFEQRHDALSRGPAHHWETAKFEVSLKVALRTAGGDHFGPRSRLSCAKVISILAPRPFGNFARSISLGLNRNFFSGERHVRRSPTVVLELLDSQVSVEKCDRSTRVASMKSPPSDCCGAK